MADIKKPSLFVAPFGLAIWLVGVFAFGWRWPTTNRNVKCASTTSTN